MIIAEQKGTMADFQTFEEAEKRIFSIDLI